jgi:hypothetical protein
MLTLDFDTKNGNRVYVMEQPTPAQQLIIGTTVIMSFVFLVGLMKVSFKFGPWIGQHLNYTVALILEVLVPMVALVVGVLAVAAAFQFVRFKILTCYGFFTIQKEHILEIHKKWDTNAEKEIDLKLYNQVKSTSTSDGYQIELSSANNEGLDIISLLAPYNNIAPFSNDAKDPKSVKVGKRTIIKRPRQYPTDELFASWLEVDLIRDGQKVDFNRSVHIF